MRKRNARRVLLGAAVVVAAACGSDAMDMVGDAMVDAGEGLRDANRADAMVDGAAGSDGAPGPTDGAATEGGSGTTATVLEASCRDEEFVRTRSPEGSDFVTAEFTRWIATFEVEGLRPEDAPRLSAVVCGRRSYGASADECPEGFTCEGEHPERLRCNEVSTRLDDGVVRVHCGYRNRHFDDETGELTVESGIAWETAHLRVVE